MEIFITSLGGLAIAGLIIITGIVIYILMNKYRTRNTPKKARSIGASKCPLCGGRMDMVMGASYVIHCNNPKCPNFATN